MSNGAGPPTEGRVNCIDGYVGDLGGKIPPEIAALVRSHELDQRHPEDRTEALIKEANDICVMDGEKIEVTMYGTRGVVIMSLNDAEYWWLDEDLYPEVVSKIVNNTQSILVKYSDKVINGL